LTSSLVTADLALNTQIRTLYASGAIPGILNDAQVAQTFRVAGVRAPFVVFDGQIPDIVTGVVGPTMGTRKVVAIRSDMGQVFTGVTPSADLMAGQGIIKRRDAAGIVAWAEQAIRPAGIITTAEAVALPVLRDPK